jgi:hypothetical protein
LAEIRDETLYRLGKFVLQELGCKDPGSHITMAKHKYAPEDIIEALGAVCLKRPADVVPYFKACLKGKEKKEENTIGGQWGMRVKNFKETGFWPIHFGPKPGEEGCQAPQE